MPADSDTRAVSRTFTVLDHATRDGLDNLMSIVGGKLTTCRQMAEALVDRLAARMGVTTPCTTATEPLPGADHGNHRLAAPLARVERQAAYGELLCECELVTTAQVRETVAAGVEELEDLRRKLRLGYGPCQAAFCAWRAAAVVCERAPNPSQDRLDSPGATAPLLEPPDPLDGLARFLQERWRGQLSTVWGDQARQALLNHAIYRGIFDLDADQPDEASAWRGGALERGAAGRGDPAAAVGHELVGDDDGRATGGSGGLKSEAATEAAGGHAGPSDSPPANKAGR